MKTVIRKATKGDCKRMMELVQELAEYEKAPEEVTVAFEHFVESGFGTHPVWWAYVAEVEGAVEGFALFYTRYSTWKGQRMYLEDLVVTEKMRGQGIGSLLMQQLLQVAKERKYSGILWQVLNWNGPAINFYKKFAGVKLDAEWINCSIEVL